MGQGKKAAQALGARGQGQREGAAACVPSTGEGRPSRRALADLGAPRPGRALFLWKHGDIVREEVQESDVHFEQTAGGTVERTEADAGPPLQGSHCSHQERDHSRDPEAVEEDKAWTGREAKSRGLVTGWGGPWKTAAGLCAWPVLCSLRRR